MTCSEKEKVFNLQRLKEILEYDPRTGEFAWTTKTSKYSPIRVGCKAGGLNNKGYVQIMIEGYSYLAHRLAWLYVYGYLPKDEKNQIDHIDGNKSNNRIENLRESSQSENMRNKKIQSNNTSGITGVRRREIRKPSGKIYYYWIAFWRDNNGKKQSRYANIEEHGEAQAKALVIAHREEQIRLLELEHGIIYSDRHGT